MVRAGALALWEDAAGPGLVQPGEPMRSSIRRSQALREVQGGRMKAMMLSLNTGGSNWTDLKTFSPVTTVRQYHKLPRVVLQSPPLEMFNIWLNKALSSLVWPYGCFCFEQRSLPTPVTLWLTWKSGNVWTSSAMDKTFVGVCYLCPGSRSWIILCQQMKHNTFNP